MMKKNIFWFRRDLRLEDNTALAYSLLEQEDVIPIFIFDEKIINTLSKNDSRITFIYNQLEKINKQLEHCNSSLLVLKGNPSEVFQNLISKYDIRSVFSNKDYEPYALQRDNKITKLLKQNEISHIQYKDQVIFEPNEILKEDGTPYTVYTPYKKKWLNIFREKPIEIFNEINFLNFYNYIIDFPTLNQIGFENSSFNVRDYTLTTLDKYKENRDIPADDKTSYLSVHLRFGTVSIRKIINLLNKNEAFLSELIWREFFMQILFNFPHVVTQSFKKNMIQ